MSQLSNALTHCKNIARIYFVFACVAVIGVSALIAAVGAYAMTWEEATRLNIVLPILAIEFTLARFPFQLASHVEEPKKQRYCDFGMLLLIVAATGAAVFGAVVAMVTHPKEFCLPADIVVGIAALAVYLFFLSVYVWGLCFATFVLAWSLDRRDAILKATDASSTTLTDNEGESADKEVGHGTASKNEDDDLMEESK
jgi:hypothetical protein